MFKYFAGVIAVIAALVVVVGLVFDTESREEKQLDRIEQHVLRIDERIKWLKERLNNDHFWERPATAGPWYCDDNGCRRMTKEWLTDQLRRAP